MNKFVMMIGLPASGKDSYIQENLSGWLRDYRIHSSDILRQEMFGDIYSSAQNTELFAELHRRLKTDLENGFNVVYNATNINRERRISFLKKSEIYNCKKICVFMATQYEICLERNKNRSQLVQEEAIEKMHKSFYAPEYFEGWDEIKIIR